MTRSILNVFFHAVFKSVARLYGKGFQNGRNMPNCLKTVFLFEI